MIGYRTPTESTAPRNATAADVVLYEQRVLGNRLGVDRATLAQLEHLPASRLLWVCLDKDGARRYGPDTPSAIVFERVIARDGEGGLLVLTLGWIQEELPL